MKDFFQRRLFWELAGLIALLHGPSFAQAQYKISGQVKDEANKGVGAVVISVQRGRGIVASTITKADGSYSLRFDKGETLVAVVYGSQEYWPNVIAGLSGQSNHSITKVVSRISREKAQVLSPAQATEAMMALDFMQQNLDLYRSLFLSYSDVVKQDVFPSQYNSRLNELQRLIATLKKDGTLDFQIEIIDNVGVAKVLTETSQQYYFSTGANCTQTTPINVTYTSLQGGKIVKADIIRDFISGNGTELQPPKIEGNVVQVRGIVRGDDDLFGFCRRPGEARFRISVTTEIRETLSRVVYSEQITKPYGEDVDFSVTIPNTSEHRGSGYSFKVTIVQYIAGDIREIELTSERANMGPWTASIDRFGNLRVRRQRRP